MNSVFKTVQYPARAVFAANLINAAENPDESHFHNDIELIMILSGDTEVCVDNNFFQASAGDIVFINSESPHYIFAQRGTEAEYLTVNVKQAFFELLSIPIQAFYINCNSAAPHGDTVALHYARLRRDLGTICEKLRTGSLPENELSIIMMGVISNILTNFSITANVRSFRENSGKNDQRVASILSYLHQNYREEVSLDELAAVNHVSVTHMCHIFKNATGTSIVQYLSELRVEKVRQLLHMMPDESITSIALNCGFRSMSYFYEVFGRKYGCTPSKYKLAVKN